MKNKTSRNPPEQILISNVGDEGPGFLILLFHFLFVAGLDPSLCYLFLELGSPPQMKIKKNKNKNPGSPTCY